MDEVNLVQNMLIAFCGYPVFVIVFTHFFADKISVWQAVGCLTAMLGLAVQALHSRPDMKAASIMLSLGGLVCASLEVICIRLSVNLNVAPTIIICIRCTLLSALCAVARLFEYQGCTTAELPAMMLGGIADGLRSIHFVFALSSPAASAVAIASIAEANSVRVLLLTAISNGLLPSLQTVFGMLTLLCGSSSVAYFGTVRPLQPDSFLETATSTTETVAMGIRTRNNAIGAVKWIAVWHVIGYHCNLSIDYPFMRWGCTWVPFFLLSADSY